MEKIKWLYFASGILIGLLALLLGSTVYFTNTHPGGGMPELMKMMSGQLDQGSCNEVSCSMP